MHLEKIKSIRYVGREQTYDLNTPTYNNFILDNGLISHNSGKSLFVLMVGILFGRPFSLVNNVTYIPKGNEIMDKFSKLRMCVFLIDEAAKQMRSVQWQDKQQQKVNVGAMTERYRNNVVFLNLPNFNEFTKSMRAGSIVFRAVIPYRTDKYARVIIQRKSRNWRSEDPWGDKRANEIYHAYDKRRKEITNDVILSIERSLPNTVMDFIIPNLENIVPDITKEYVRLKIESRKQDKESEVTYDKINLYKGKYEDLLSIAAKALYMNELHIGKIRVTKHDIAKKLQISQITLSKNLLREVIKKRLKTFRDA